jgi:hypothetical protein
MTDPKHNLSNSGGKATSLRDLPQSIQPPRDLWAGIEAQLSQAPVSAAPPVRRTAPLRWLAAAAMVAALAVGVWIGRASLPGVGGPGIRAPQSESNANFVQAAYLADPKFRAQRAALMKSLDAKLAGLPPGSRAKVVASLQAIHKSMQDLAAALGKDPANALLQELLMNTYQDEMRVLTTVDEASQSGKGI